MRDTRVRVACLRAMAELMMLLCTREQGGGSGAEGAPREAIEPRDASHVSEQRIQVGQISTREKRCVLLTRHATSATADPAAAAVILVAAVSGEAASAVLGVQGRG